MNSTTRGLLRDIVATPRDNGLRLILADYLEDQHQGHQPEVRAAMIREQVPPRGEFRTTTDADSDSYMIPWKASTAWGAAFPRRINLNTFVGGLPSLAHINARDFCSVAQDVVDLFPLEKVFLQNVFDRHLRVFDHPAMAQISKLAIRAPRMSEAIARAFAASRRLACLQELDLQAEDLDNKVARILIESQVLPEDLTLRVDFRRVSYGLRTALRARFPVVEVRNR